MLNQVIVILLIKMDEDQWAYYSKMSEEVDMDFQDEQDCGANEGHVDCSDAFNTSQVIMSISFNCLV